MHSIEKISIEIGYNNEKNSLKFQKELNSFIEEKVTEEIEKTLKSLKTQNEYLFFEKLDLNLETVNYKDYKSGFLKRLNQSLTNAIKDQIRLNRHKIIIGDSKSSHSKDQLLINYLKNGTLPWWIDSSKSIIEIIKPEEKKDIEALKELISENSNNPILIKRFVFQFPKEIVFKVIESVSKNYYQTVYSFYQRIRSSDKSENIIQFEDQSSIIPASPQSPPPQKKVEKDKNKLSDDFLIYALSEINHSDKQNIVSKFIASQLEESIFKDVSLLTSESIDFKGSIKKLYYYLASGDFSLIKNMKGELTPVILNINQKQIAAIKLLLINQKEAWKHLKAITSPEELIFIAEKLVQSNNTSFSFWHDELLDLIITEIRVKKTDQTADVFKTEPLKVEDKEEEAIESQKIDEPNKSSTNRIKDFENKVSLEIIKGLYKYLINEIKLSEVKLSIIKTLREDLKLTKEEYNEISRKIDSTLLKSKEEFEKITKTKIENKERAQENDFLAGTPISTIIDTNDTINFIEKLSEKEQLFKQLLETIFDLPKKDVDSILEKIEMPNIKTKLSKLLQNELEQYELTKGLHSLLSSSVNIFEQESKPVFNKYKTVFKKIEAQLEKLRKQNKQFDLKHFNKQLKLKAKQEFESLSKIEKSKDNSLKEKQESVEIEETAIKKLELDLKKSFSEIELSDLRTQLSFLITENTAIRKKFSELLSENELVFFVKIFTDNQYEYLKFLEIISTIIFKSCSIHSQSKRALQIKNYITLSYRYKNNSNSINLEKLIITAKEFVKSEYSEKYQYFLSELHNSELIASKKVEISRILTKNEINLIENTKHIEFEIDRKNREQFSEVYINNVGLVILAPYLEQFFKNLDLLENREFRNEEARERGVLILRYLTDKNTIAEEPELILNKLLCGMDVKTPINLDIELSEEEKNESEKLLQAVIKHWTALKSMGPDSLRVMFLKRQAKLERQNNDWKLTVEKNQFDLLIAKIPWTFNIVKTPWMDYLIYTEW